MNMLMMFIVGMFMSMFHRFVNVCMVVPFCQV